jgi:hypothetical protein
MSLEFIQPFQKYLLDITGLQIELIPIIVGTCVLIGVLIFILGYFRPAFSLGIRLQKYTKRLIALKLEYEDQQLIPCEKVAVIFSENKLFKHLWSEFQETLHDQYQYSDGEKKIVQIRATLPAETFFNSQVVVDSPINAEFFKHLPGILTGIGIIGTFLGLIIGLNNFDTSAIGIDPDLLNQQLESLIGSVKEAFIASGFAIFFAMIITIFEKWNLNILYGRHERMTQAIDALYDAGAGEEYLSQLVQYTEENSAQTRHLKYSLVSDLKHLLTELTERQITATQMAGKYMANEISQSISQSLETPLSQIAGVVHQASSEQGTAVQGMLQDLLSAFMAKIDETFGDQMKGLNAMMEASARALSETQSGLTSLVSQLAEASKDTSRSMGEQLVQMMQAAETRQQMMVAKLDETVRTLTDRLSNVQGEMHSQLADGVNDLKNVMQSAMSELAEQRKSLSQSSAEDMQQLQAAMNTLLETVSQSGQNMAQQYSDKMAASLDIAKTQLEQFLRQSGEIQQSAQTKTGSLLDSLEDKVLSLIASSKESAEATKASIQSLQSVTTRAVDGMNQGADRMKSAADAFTTAGNSVSNVMKGGDVLYQKIIAASGTLESSTSLVRDVISSYEQSRQGVEQMVTVLRDVTQILEEKTGVSRDVVNSMEQVVNKFKIVQTDMQEYLNEVSDVLNQGFDAFADAVTTNMSKAKGEFDNSLSDAVQMIAAQLQELEEVLDNVISRRK